MVARPDHEAAELRAVAPLIAIGDSPRLVGPITLVANGDKVIGVTSAELARPFHGVPLAVLTRLDGSAMVDVAAWRMGRYSGLGLVELTGPIPNGHDVVPLDIGEVCATIDIRGAPAALVTVAPATAGGFQRELIAVYVDADDGGGMSDTVKRLASPIDPAHAQRAVEGAALFAWFPPDPALGRPSEVLVVALASPYRAHIAKPREAPVIAELIGLDDLGRALLSMPDPDAHPELKQVAGEIVDPTPASSDD